MELKRRQFLDEEARQQNIFCVEVHFYFFLETEHLTSLCSLLHE
jgi:hypothetical protein